MLNVAAVVDGDDLKFPVCIKSNNITTPSGKLGVTLIVEIDCLVVTFCPLLGVVLVV